MSLQFGLKAGEALKTKMSIGRSIGKVQSPQKQRRSAAKWKRRVAQKTPHSWQPHSPQTERCVISSSAPCAEQSACAAVDDQDSPQLAPPRVYEADQIWSPDAIDPPINGAQQRGIIRQPKSTHKGHDHHHEKENLRNSAGSGLETSLPSPVEPAALRMVAPLREGASAPRRMVRPSRDAAASAMLGMLRESELVAAQSQAATTDRGGAAAPTPSKSPSEVVVSDMQDARDVPPSASPSVTPLPDVRCSAECPKTRVLESSHNYAFKPRTAQTQPESEPQPQPQPQPQSDLEPEPMPEAAPQPCGVFAPAQLDKLERIFSGGDTAPSDAALQMYAAVIGRPPGGWQSDPHTDLAAWFARKSKGANTFSPNGPATAAAKAVAAAAPGAPAPTQAQPPPDVEILMGMGYDPAVVCPAGPRLGTLSSSPIDHAALNGRESSSQQPHRPSRDAYERAGHAASAMLEILRESELAAAQSQATTADREMPRAAPSAAAVSDVQDAQDVQDAPLSAAPSVPDVPDVQCSAAPVVVHPAVPVPVADLAHLVLSGSGRQIIVVDDDGAMHKNAARAVCAGCCMS